MQFLVTSKKAIEIISVLTLFKPFGGFVWAATCAMIASQTTFLFIIRKMVNSFQIYGKIGIDFKGMFNLKVCCLYLPFHSFTAFPQILLCHWLCFCKKQGPLHGDLLHTTCPNWSMVDMPNVLIPWVQVYFVVNVGSYSIFQGKRKVESMPL